MEERVNERQFMAPVTRKPREQGQLQAQLAKEDLGLK